MFSGLSKKLTKEKQVNAANASLNKLLDLVKHNDTVKVQKILADAKDAMPYSWNNYSDAIFNAVKYAAENGNENMLQVFYKAGLSAYSSETIIALLNPLENLPELVKQNATVEIKKLLFLAKAFHASLSKEQPHIKQAVIVAAEEDNVPLLTLLMDEGINTNGICPNDKSLLLSCVIARKSNVVTQLLRNYTLSRREDHNDDSKRAMGIATDKNFEEIALALIQAGVDPDLGSRLSSPYTDDYPMLLVAAMKGQRKVAQALVDRGASVAKAILGLEKHYLSQYYAAQARAKNIATDDVTTQDELQTTLETYSNTLKTLLDFAAGTDIEIDYFVPAGMDVSGFNFVGLSFKGVPVTPETFKRFDHKRVNSAMFSLDDIARLAQGTHLTELNTRLQKMLVERGTLVTNGVVNLVPIVVAAQNNDLNTVRARMIACQGVVTDDLKQTLGDALVWAANRNFGNIVDCLLDYNNNRIPKSALLSAYLNTNDPLIRGRIGIYIDVNDVDNAKNTKLHFAAQNNDLKEVQNLVSIGANPTALNNLAETPLNSALKNHKVNIAIVELLATKDTLQANKRYDTNARDWRMITPLEDAIRNKCDISIVRFLLEKSIQHAVPLDILRLSKVAIQKSFDGALALLLPRLTVDETARESLSSSFNALPQHGDTIAKLSKDIKDCVSFSTFSDYRAERLAELREADKAVTNIRSLLSEHNLLNAALKPKPKGLVV